MYVQVEKHFLFNRIILLSYDIRRKNPGRAAVSRRTAGTACLRLFYILCIVRIESISVSSCPKQSRSVPDVYTKFHNDIPRSNEAVKKFKITNDGR